MARYTHDFMGMENDPRGWSSGKDPNYRGGYRGTRMQAEEGQAPYGWHRWRHEEDFEGSGGYMGGYRQQEPSMRQGAPRAPQGRYDTGWGSGGSRNVRDFHADRAGGRYGGEYRGSRYGGEHGRGPGPRRGPAPGHFQGERFDYANRGLTSGGYSEGWAWGPVRGSR